MRFIKAIVLIPAYKPNKALIETAENLAKAGYRILVVDDGSGENFSDIFKTVESFAKVIHQNPNMGKGAALKNGISYIIEKEPDCDGIITADADGQHTVPDIIKISDFLENNGGFVIGARKFEGKVPFRSRFGNTITKGVFALASGGTYVSDTQTGLRGFSKDLFEFMRDISGDRYEYEMNVLMQCAASGVKINEVSISTVYENNNESSHFNAVRDSAKIYRVIFANSVSLKYIISSLISFGIDFALLEILYSFLLPSSIAVSTLLARCVSAPCNYLLNRLWVFKSDSDKLKSFIEYLLLACAVIGSKMLLMKLFVDVIGLGSSVSNLIVETLLFISNFLIQKIFIFKRKKK